MSIERLADANFKLLVLRREKFGLGALLSLRGRDTGQPGSCLLIRFAGLWIYLGWVWGYGRIDIR